MKIALLAIFAVTTVQAAPPAKGPAAVTFEAIPGASHKRVILAEKAAQRLGIETAKVSEAPVLKRQMVAGLVVPAALAQKQAEPKAASLARGFGGFAVPTASVKPAVTKSASGDTLVQVTLSPAEYERLARDKPVRLLPLATRAELKSALLAQPSGMQPVEDLKRSMLTLYYVLPQGDHAATMNKRMRVELPLAGSDATRKIVPYSAIHYDARGQAWVYVSPRPLAYERQRVGVEQVTGDFAVLSDGPAVGTNVVSVGASLLYGTEVFGK